ncbi:thioesterase domain-containing protein [Paraflavitalea soli]|nr:thioesterase domain-containing protein [Paraflavitalea soli]
MVVAETPATQQSAPSPIITSPVNRHLLLLQPTGEGRPIFIVPGSNGISEGYDELATEFTGVCPVYGIQMQGVFEGEKPLTDIRQIAALHNRWIREVQPSGPYRLIGHSFGAHVVYEMAHQLEQQGEVIECIAMLDKHPQKRRLRIDDPVAFAWQAVADMFTTYKWTLTGSEPDLLAMEVSLTGEDVMTNFHQITTWIAKTQPDPHGALAHGLRLLQLRLTNALLDYKLLGRLKAPLIIARAAEAAWQDWGEDLGWQKRTSQAIPLLVPGDHFSMIKEAGARVLGEIIKRKLGECSV